MLQPEYILGLVDGEGSFTVYVKNPDERKNVKRRVRAEPKFYLKLIEKDKMILSELKDFFGCGNVYYQKDTRKNHHDCYRYEVANRDDLRRVILPFFRKHPLRFPSKKKDFEMFCRIMKMIEKGNHLSREGLRQIYHLKQTMH
ncbi:MAG: LAGLIDADG homing endonuclease [Candidatus Jorgensenbacteria bacterium GW2011_GWA2_45_13]|uniref:LAGLIDADG homing endonuclease n=1 Tax=Candidatus Jorgensenbacteria bacterium GW2011_GWA2_45_13 TaxID=1618662 RepID=A0A0G1L8D0_9BACT|nr:MAG: LAGLIDADG homing endonuclease [Candidatus Jorgensenbacteria bacterium GW2011_GWA2_45_13]